MTVPRATVRLQFHRGFTFGDAIDLVGYFASLGVSHIYASPIMTARPGSTHGYDIIDPTQINPELGGEEEFRRYVGALRGHGLGLIVDIVPNHMAIGTGNRWWMDVLANGRLSNYAKYFDIDWRPANPALRDKMLLPILGRSYGEALAAGEISLQAAGKSLVIRHFDHELPVANADSLRSKIELAAFDPATVEGRQRLHQLLEEQHYRLAWWRVANDEINWRRFFDISELAAIRVEDGEVFGAVHAKLFSLYAEGLIDGVRVDHIDGLTQPESYCKKLRGRLRELEKDRPDGSPRGPAYFVVEKILAHNESLVKSWETDGTTGYDFMDQVSLLFHMEAGERPLRRLWRRVSERPEDFATEEEVARRQVLQRSFSAQKVALARALNQIGQGSLTTRDITYAAICRVLTEILVHFPVYRIYARPHHSTPSDQYFLSQAVDRAKTTCLPSDEWLVETIGEQLLGQNIGADADALQAVAMARFQQLSAPLCAKAVEDTAFYRYGRLLSRNDVGFDAGLFALPLSEFHRKMQQRAVSLPHSMLATATHDHKRGEDVRARLAVLSEVAEEWTKAVERWIRGQ